MLFLLSPAKTLDMASAPATVERSHACFVEECGELVEELQKLTVQQLKALLGVSDALAKLNCQRYSEWTNLEEKQAALAFDEHLGDLGGALRDRSPSAAPAAGPAYQALSANTLDAGSLDYLQTHLRILCGLYGVLRPLDLIRPYRLDMSKRLANSKGKDLYCFWRERVSSALAREAQQQPEGSQVVVDCASQEYFKAVDQQALGVPVYTMSFPGPAVYAKQARGAIVRFAAQTSASSPADLKGFKGLNGEWAYSEQRSSEHDFVFVRLAGKAAKRRGKAGTEAENSEDREKTQNAQGTQPGRGASKRRRK